MMDTYLRNPSSLMKGSSEDEQMEVNEPDPVQMEINKVEFQNKKLELE